MAGFVDIVGLAEALVAQALKQRRHRRLVGDAHLDGRLVESLAAWHFLSQGFGACHHPAGLLIAPRVEHLSTQNLRRSIYLAILDVAFVATGQNLHPLVAVNLADVVVDIAGGVEIVGNNQKRLFGLFKRSKKQCGSRAFESVKAYATSLTLGKECRQSLDAGRGGEYF